MKISKILYGLTGFLLMTTSVQAMDARHGWIPLDPEEELSKIPVTPALKDQRFQEGLQFEQAQKYEEAAAAYKQAGVSGHEQAFIRLGYLYEEGKLKAVETVEERRLMDALAGFYIEKGVEQGGGLHLFGKLSQFHSTANLEENEGSVPSFTLAEIHEDNTLAPPEKFIKIAQWYENQRRPNETIAQKRLRYAYAGRYYDEAALWHFSPIAYTALGHMYHSGKGIDISDEEMNLSSRMQAKEYYQGYMETKADPEGQFMMGFLLEQERERKSDKKAVLCYQLAARKNYAPAAFRLGLRAEHGQITETDILKFYQQAERFSNWGRVKKKISCSTTALMFRV